MSVHECITISVSVDLTTEMRVSAGLTAVEGLYFLPLDFSEARCFIISEFQRTFTEIEIIVLGFSELINNFTVFPERTGQVSR